MGSDKEDKIEKYHFEEIVFILLILAIFLIRNPEKETEGHCSEIME
jgi:hypothetical protein